MYIYSFIQRNESGRVQGLMKSEKLSVWKVTHKQRSFFPWKKSILVDSRDLKINFENTCLRFFLTSLKLLFFLSFFFSFSVQENLLRFTDVYKLLFLELLVFSPFPHPRQNLPHVRGRDVVIYSDTYIVSAVPRRYSTMVKRFCSLTMYSTVWLLYS